MDEKLRRLKRLAQNDPQAARQLLVETHRSGHALPIERWYRAHITPLGIEEEDFKEVVRWLVQGYYWKDNRVRGPKDWSWIGLSDPNRCVLAVRDYSRDPANQRILANHIVIGHAVAGAPPQAGSMMWDTAVIPETPQELDRLHPRNLWPELRVAYGDRTIPTFFYQSFERSRGLLPMPQTSGATWTHGCEVHGPDPCHADVPHNKMRLWSRQDAPNRTSFSVFEARLYTGLDPETGSPPGHRSNPIEDEARFMYHATYRAYLPSILKNGLGGVDHTNWDASDTGVVCLAPDPEEAESYAECAPDVGLVPVEVEASGIVILAVDVTGLPLEDDPNIDEEDISCMIYRGVISPKRIFIYAD